MRDDKAKSSPSKRRPQWATVMLVGAATASCAAGGDVAMRMRVGAATASSAAGGDVLAGGGDAGVCVGGVLDGDAGAFLGAFAGAVAFASSFASAHAFFFAGCW